MAYYAHDRSGNRWHKPFVVGLVILFALLVAGVVVLRQVYTENLRPVSTTQRNQLFTVPLGASAKEVAANLKQAGLIRSEWAFEAYVRNNNVRDKIQAGSYYLSPSQSVNEIVAILTHGEVATDLVTILPAQRLDQISQSLVKSGFPQDEVKAALNPENYKNHPALVDKPLGASLEGYLYPDSFQKTATTKPEVIVRASLDQMQKYLTPQVREGIVRQGLTVHEGIILASIVEQEVGKPEDRPKVAQVFLKRLRDGMALESDATAGYGAVLDGQPPSLTYPSPYNTYLNKGLTPGPISNVSVTSLLAVANPAPTDFVYFVSGDDGITHFSRTLEEHQALTRQYCKKLCAQP